MHQKTYIWLNLISGKYEQLHRKAFARNDKCFFNSICQPVTREGVTEHFSRVSIILSLHCGLRYGYCDVKRAHLCTIFGRL